MEVVLKDEHAGVDLTMLRLFRLLKLARLFRALRTVRLFRDLNVMVIAIASSFRSVMWSMMLLGLIVMWCSTFICQLMLHYVSEESNPAEHRKWIFENYGSTSRASYTMFQATLSGCWPNYSEPVIQNVSGWFVYFWILYVVVVVFAITRIISGYFFLEAMAAKSSSTDLLLAEQNEKRTKVLSKLNQLFMQADNSGDGELDRDEFEKIMTHPEVRSYLQSLELDIHEEAGLFQLIDDGDEKITYPEFITGVMRLKGQARAVDMVSVMRDLSKLRRQMDMIAEAVAPAGYTGISRSGLDDTCRTLTRSLTRSRKSISGHCFT
mmetsp:Transcript_112746/g.177393  ORF Transcript_112746/g.177393 Transcript_112746/m.177393 type:complete len:322 (+) Transcript_112746:1-966(+)